MSKRPLKVTGFTRFFIVMLLVAPLAYIGASYYNGENGIEKIKQFLKIGSTETEVVEEKTPTTNEKVLVNESPASSDLVNENKKLKEELEFKAKRIDELYRENEELKRKLQSAEKALEETKSK